MDDTVQVQCPYCFELVDLYIDPQQRGEMVQDCDVCCHPWRVLVSRRRDEKDKRNVLVQRTVKGVLYLERLGDLIGQTSETL